MTPQPPSSPLTREQIDQCFMALLGDGYWQTWPRAATTLLAVVERIEVLEQSRTNLFETLRGIANIPVTDGVRMRQWAQESLSGFMEPLDSTLLKLSDSNAALRATITRLEGVLKGFLDAMMKYGNWDDGCFYYNGTSATELEMPIKQAQQARGE